jgi:hypothetical protein
MDRSMGFTLFGPYCNHGAVEPQMTSLGVKDDRRPKTIIWFTTGVAAVCDQFGQQMPEYQGTHQETLLALKRDGWVWTAFPEIYGCPNPGLALD